MENRIKNFDGNRIKGVLNSHMQDAVRFGGRNRNTRGGIQLRSLGILEIDLVMTKPCLFSVKVLQGGSCGVFVRHLDEGLPLPPEDERFHQLRRMGEDFPDVFLSSFRRDVHEVEHF
eukprot:Lithocolla_globosa_v1_NODE_3683_length_1605_cov_14.802708.p4 type:complete len:117 gc:universal NODE_3683_length_1605_cov_14.802708:458-108(-)